MARDLFGKGKDAARREKEEKDRQAAEEVERITRRGGPGGGMGGAGGGMGGGMGGPFGTGSIGPPSPLEMMAAEVREREPIRRGRDRGSRRGAAEAPNPFQSAAIISGSVGAGLGPAGLSPGPRSASAARRPQPFDPGSADDAAPRGPGGDFGRDLGGFDDAEEEEMTVTEMALMDQAARKGLNPEELVIQYDPADAEEMRDRAMQQFLQRQQSMRRPARTDDPTAPAGLRGRAAAPTGRAVSPLERRQRMQQSAGGALAARVAAKRQREQEEAAQRAETRLRTEEATVRPGPAPVQEDDDYDEQPDEPAGGALARLLAQRRQQTGIDEPAAPVADFDETDDEADDEADQPMAMPPGRLHAEHRQATRTSPQTDDDMAPSADLEQLLARSAAGGRKATAKKVTAKRAVSKRPATKAAARKAPAAKAVKAMKAPTGKMAPAGKKAVATAAVAGAPAKRTASKAAKAATPAPVKKTRAATPAPPLPGTGPTPRAPRAAKAATKAPAKKTAKVTTKKAPARKPAR